MATQLSARPVRLKMSSARKPVFGPLYLLLFFILMCGSRIAESGHVQHLNQFDNKERSTQGDILNQSNEDLALKSSTHEESMQTGVGVPWVKSGRTIGPQPETLNTLQRRKRNANAFSFSPALLSQEERASAQHDDVGDCQGATELKSIGDTVSCSSCTCSHLSNGKAIANCSYEHIFDVPKEFHRDTWMLIMLGTWLNSFNTQSLLNYPSLCSVSVVSNHGLRRVTSEPSGNLTSGVKYLDLSCNKIATIEDGSFSFMPMLKNLSIRYNQIKNITNTTFAGLENLQALELSDNHISYIEYGAFDRMKKLVSLGLRRNKRLGYHHNRFAPRLFLYLKNLKYLYVQGNSNGEDHYPEDALQELPNLELLNIDALAGGVEFGPKMKNLTHLTQLQMGSNGHCYMRDIPDTYFENIPYLERLELYRCRMHNVDGRAFVKLPKLRHLYIGHMRNYDLMDAFEDLIGLKNSSLKSLAMIHLYHSTSPCRFLSKEQGKYIKTMPLEELDLSENRLALLQNDFLCDLPRTLKRFILRRNKFTLVGLIINKITFLRELVEIDLSEQNLDEWSVALPDSHTIRNWCAQFPFPKDNVLAIPDEAQEATRIRYWEEGTTNLSTEAPYDNPTMTTSAETQEPLKVKDGENNNTQLLGENMCKEQKSTLYTEEPKYELLQGLVGSPSGRPYHILPLPPKLRTLTATQFNNYGMILLTHILLNTSVLEEVDFSRSFLSQWGSGGLPPQIKRADFSDNFCKLIVKEFFSPNNSLQSLTLRNNFLGSNFADDTDGDIFAELHQTQYLDLTVNMIYELPEQFFKGLTSLQVLYLSDNKLQVLNTTFANMTKLTLLDLSRNSISWIKEKRREELDNIAALHQIRLDLRDNPLPCTCSGVEVLEWMAITNVTLLHKDELTCTLEDGRKTLIGDLDQRVASLKRFCASKAIIVVICVASFAVISVIVAFAMMYRYRWKLRYLHNIAIAKLEGFRPRQVEEIGYKFDAYLIYSNDSLPFVLRYCVPELEVKRGHKLCLQDREFMPGTSLVSNMVSAIQNSTKTVPIITPDLYEGEHTEYSIKMAVMEEIHMKRSLLHLCVLDPVPDDDMSRDMLMVMKRNDYIEYPPDEEATEEIRRNFWDQLSRAIGHTNNAERRPELDVN